MVFGVVSAPIVLRNEAWIGARIGAGLLLAGAGFVCVVYAYTFISRSKEFELVGFDGGEQVTPKPWYVGLYRVMGLGLSALGFVLFDGLLLV